MLWNFLFSLLWYLIGARYYDPELGIWLSVDPVKQFPNSFLFCSNNPLNYSDTNGEWSFKHFFSTLTAELFKPYIEMARAIKHGDGESFFKNLFFGATPTGTFLNTTEGLGTATWSVLPDVQNNWGYVQKYGWLGGAALGLLFGGDPLLGAGLGLLTKKFEWKPEAGAHGGSEGDPKSYENYINAQKKNVKSKNPFKRWEAKGRIAHTVQDRKHHSQSSLIKGPWHMILGDEDFENFEDYWFPGMPDAPGMGILRIWEGSSEYYEEVYGTDWGL